MRKTLFERMSDIARGEPKALCACSRCMDLGVVARNTPSEWDNLYQGKPLRGRYLDPCPEVGCAARVREFGK